MTTANTIRSALKALGYGARDVSIRTRRATGSVRIEIKNWAVPFQTVREIAAKHENVRRDDSGEILSGGNIFVTVRYADRALDAQILMIHNMLREGRTAFGTLRLSFDASDPDSLHAWEVADGRHVGEFSRQHGAAAFAETLAMRGELTCLGRTQAEEFAIQVAAAAADLANDVEPPAAVDYSADPNFTLC